MSYYGGTITAQGRNLITSLIAGETIEFTKVMVGSGKMPDGTDPMDMTALVNPIAAAASSVPIVENSVLSMVVEYRNDMNGGLTEGFWLNEFGIFAKTANTDETLLYYATLGDSPQPVNAYKDNRIDIRRYPISIELEVDADVKVSYNPSAFITSAEANDLLAALVDEIGSARINDITIPASAWTKGTDAVYPYYADVALASSTEAQYPNVTLYKASLSVASDAGLCPTVQSLDGKLRFWANTAPAADMAATVALLSNGTGRSTGTSAYVLPAATSTTLGGVKVGSGISVQADGTISVDTTATSNQIDAALTAATATNAEADTILAEKLGD